MNVALILASGIGLRFGANRPKQYLPLNGKEIISYPIDAAKQAKSIDKIVVVCNQPYDKEIEKKYGVETTIGCDTRNKSFRKGLDYIKSKYDCAKVILMDGVRPFITGTIIDDFMNKLDEYDICVASNKITDYLCSALTHVCDRDDYMLTAAPEAFRYELIYKYLEPNSTILEPLQMCPADINVFFYQYVNNYKVTYSEDIPLYEAMMKIIEERRKGNK